jgi:hypothetical protein
MVTWDRTPLGLETAAPCKPRAALAVEGRKDAGISKNSKVPALHREAERDTTGSFNRQPPVHTLIGGVVQGTYKGSVAVLQHSALFAETVLSCD